VTWIPGFDETRRPGPADRIFAFSDGRFALGDPPDAGGAVYIGELDGRACFALELAELPEGLESTGLRDAFAFLDADEAALAGRAIQILEWERQHRFCGRCGAETEPAGHEAARACPGCGARYYPRISPAVIMLVTRGEELLLASRPGGATYSCLAGFVEAGETLEQTVVREVREEVGLEVGDVRYFGSQPWPFPGQLMIGFTAEWKSGEIAVDESELGDAAWFPRGGLPPIPPPFTIARRLIDAVLAR
jgi:NAD+ diphosphatase